MSPTRSRSSWLLPIALLFACNPPVPPELEGGDTPKKEEQRGRKEQEAKPKKATEKTAAAWTGFFTGTLPCADCPGIRTELWVRPDSTFILGQRYIDRDSMAFAQFGKWRVVNGRLAVGSGTDKPDLWKQTPKGLVKVDENGQEWALAPKMALDRQGTSAKIPVMRVTGAYVFHEGAHSFTPCGSYREFPLAVSGGDLGLEKLYTKRFKKKDDKLYVELEATVGTAEAQEGAAKDEYVFPKKLVRVLNVCP
ncbi:MAG: copper resistance protein NlpE N-terminal domain-containing protein [Flavobacteriales bacterium]